MSGDHDRRDKWATCTHLNARISARRGTMAVGARRPASVALSVRATSDSPRDGRAAARITAVLATTHAAMSSRRSACDKMASHSLLLNIKIHGSRIQRKTGPVQVQGPLWKTVLLHFRKKRCHRRILPVAVLLLFFCPYCRTFARETVISFGT